MQGCIGVTNELLLILILQVIKMLNLEHTRLEKICKIGWKKALTQLQLIGQKNTGLRGH
jgi:hypothetical protein